MIHYKSIKNLAIKDFDIIKRKLEIIDIALKKIAKVLGENEYESIYNFEKQNNIKVEFQEVGELRGRNIWIWVIIPYSKESLELVRGKICKFDIPLLEFIKSFYIFNQKFIKYPEKVESCRVNKEIFGLLKEMHGISSSYFKDYEWEQIQNSDTWIKTQAEIAREFVADKLLNESKALLC